MSGRSAALALAWTLIGAVSQAPAPQPGLSDYEIGPDDILRITVYGHDDLTQTVVVQSDGTFIFPLIGRVPAAGSTTTALGRALETRLSQDLVRNPQVSVVVQEYRSHIVFVVGEVSRPGAHPLSGRTSLVQVLASAGPTPNAGAEIVIVRPPPGTDVREPMLPPPSSATTAPGRAQPTVIRVKVRDLEDGNFSQNLELLPGDTVFVPEAPKVFVTGEVRSPGAFGYFPGMTVRQLISVAGGLTQYGSDGRLRVVRQAQGKSQEIKIRLDDAVLPGDTLVVRRKLF
jgi:polysaccharide biosynthesis/export protein